MKLLLLLPPLLTAQFDLNLPFCSEPFYKTLADRVRKAHASNSSVIAEQIAPLMDVEGLPIMGNLTFFDVILFDRIEAFVSCFPGFVLFTLFLRKLLAIEEEPDLLSHYFILDLVVEHFQTKWKGHLEHLVPLVSDNETLKNFVKTHLNKDFLEPSFFEDADVWHFMEIPLFELLEQQYYRAQKNLASFLDIRSHDSYQPQEPLQSQRTVCLQFVESFPSDPHLLLSFVASRFLQRWVAHVCVRDQTFVAGSFVLPPLEDITSFCWCSELFPEVQFTLGPMDGWRVLPFPAAEVDRFFADAVAALRSAQRPSSVSLRHKTVDVIPKRAVFQALFALNPEGAETLRERLARIHAAFEFGGPSKSATLPEFLEFFHLIRGVRELPRTAAYRPIEQAPCSAHTVCYSLQHRRSELLESGVPDILLSSADPASNVQSFETVAMSPGLFRYSVDEEYFVSRAPHLSPNVPYLPWMVQAAVPSSAMHGVFVVPVDFFGPCREQMSWLVVDLIQALNVLVQLGPGTIVVEPVFAHMVEDRRWKSIPHGEFSLEAWRSVCQLSGKEEYVPFHHLFDAPFLESFLRDHYDVQFTATFLDFATEIGVLDMLFLTGHAAQPGGLVDDLEEPDGPHIACEDILDFDRFVRVFDRDIYVRRVVCIGIGGNGADYEKLGRFLHVFQALGLRSLGFYGYGLEGVDRPRLSMNAVRTIPALVSPSMWAGVRLAPKIHSFVRSLFPNHTGPLKTKVFTALHWRRRNMTGVAGNPLAQQLLKTYSMDSTVAQANQSSPEHMAFLTTNCQPEALKCSDVFLMTNVQRPSQLLSRFHEHYVRLSPCAGASPELLEFPLEEASRLIPRAPGLSQFAVEIAAACEADYFLGYGSSWMGRRAVSSPSYLVMQLRMHHYGKKFADHDWVFFRRCSWKESKVGPLSAS